MGIKVCFTGHRPNKLPGGFDTYDRYVSHYLFKTGKKPEVYDKLIDIITMTLSELHDDFGIDEIIVGGAIGIDTIALLTAIDFKNKNNLSIKISLYAPFKEQDSVWTENSKRLYHYLNKEYVDEVVYVDRVKNVKPFDIYRTAKMQIRNKAMIDDSNVVIAVFDGTSGGTHNAYQHAKNKGKCILKINPNKPKLADRLVAFK